MRVQIGIFVWLQRNGVRPGRTWGQTGGIHLPHKKSTIKRLRQSKKLNERNRAVKSKVATAIKRAETAPPEEREARVREATSVIDKAVKSNVIKKNTASRRKSRIMKSGDA